LRCQHASLGLLSPLGSGHRRGPAAVTVGELIAVGGSLLRLGGSVGCGATAYGVVAAA